ncbi:MAG TPA: hypothetical protein VGM88_18375 [Kofleriaceae bacterium]|jgi:hypothetical protein
MGARSLVALALLGGGCQLVFGEDTPRLGDAGGSNGSDSGHEVVVDTPIDTHPIDTMPDTTTDTAPPCTPVSTTWLDWCALPAVHTDVTLNGLVNYAIDTDSAGYCDPLSTPVLCIIHGNHITIQGNTNFISSPATHRGVALYADYDVQIPINATLSVASTTTNAGAGYYAQGTCVAAAAGNKGGGAGGTGSTVGANGGGWEGGATGGVALASPIARTFGPLVPGCAGDNGNGTGAGRGGYGGGILYIGASVSIDIAGTVRADGGGATRGNANDAAGGGGGAGGLVVLETNSVSVTGTISATGGGGAGGAAGSNLGTNGANGANGGGGGMPGDNGGQLGGAGGNASVTTSTATPSLTATPTTTGGSTGTGNPSGPGGGGGGAGTLQLSLPSGQTQTP